MTCAARIRLLLGVLLSAVLVACGGGPATGSEETPQAQPSPTRESGQAEPVPPDAAEPGPEAGSVPPYRSGPVPGPAPAPEPGADPDLDGDTDPGTEPDPGTGSDSDPEPRQGPAPGPAPPPGSAPESEAEPTPAPAPAPAPKPGPASKPAPAPAPKPAPPPAPAPAPAPTSESPSRGGVPLDIEAFDEIDSEPVSRLDSEIRKRCGSAAGSPDCLIPKEKPRKVPDAVRDHCRIETLDYTPDKEQDPDGLSGGKLYRGTVVTITAVCFAPFDDLVGQTLSSFDEAVQERCAWLNCSATPELPAPVTEPAQRAACTVTKIAYAPPPRVAAGWPHPVLEKDTRVTVTTKCGNGP